MSQVCTIDTIRTLAFGSVAATYTAVGTPTTNAVRLICFTNTTNADVYFSDDGINNKIIVAAGGFKLLDVCSNRDDSNGVYLLPSNTQWYVKRVSGAPGSGSVYIEVLYGMP